MAEITVGDFKRELSIFDDDAVLDFSGLDFYRLKLRGEKHVQVEFNQHVYRDGSGHLVVGNLD